MDKGISLACLADHMNFSLNDAVSFGDNDNDASMFEKTGMSFAVSNGTEKALEAATNVANSCDDDGIFDACSKFFPELGL